MKRDSIVYNYRSIGSNLLYTFVEDRTLLGHLAEENTFARRFCPKKLSHENIRVAYSLPLGA